MSGEASGMQTPARLFRDEVVLNARSPIPKLDLVGAFDAVESARGGGQLHVVSEGASPIKRQGIPAVLNVEEVSLINRRKQVLDDLMLLSSEGIALEDTDRRDLSSRSARGLSPSRQSPVGSARGSPSVQEDPRKNALSFAAFSHTRKEVLEYCMFTDVAFVADDAIPHPFGLNNNHLEKEDRHPHSGKGLPAFLFWVRAEKGTLGIVDLRRKTRRVLLRGLARPSRVQVVANRVYWLETGTDWQFNGRLSYLDRTTERVHVLLSGLTLPRALHVTPSHDIFFLEVERTQEPRRRQAPESAEKPSKVRDEDLDDERGRDLGEPEGTWRLSWRLRGLAGPLVNLAVAGANFGIQRRKQTHANLGGPEDIWWDLDDHVQDIDGVTLYSLDPPPPTPRGSPGDISIRYVGMATPTDITVLGEGDGGNTVIVIGLTRFSIPEGPELASGSARSLDEGEETNVDKLRSAMFNDISSLPPGARVDGGALMWLTLDYNSDTTGSEQDEDNANRVPNTICIVKFPVDRVHSSLAGISVGPLDASQLEEDVVMATLVLSSNTGMLLPPGTSKPRDAAMQLECMHAYGWGLAALAIPSSCSMGLIEAQNMTFPLVSRGVRCFDIASGKSISRIASYDQIIYNSGESSQDARVCLLCDNEVAEKKNKFQFPWRDVLRNRNPWHQLTVPKTAEYMDEPVGVGDDEFSEFLVQKHASFKKESGGDYNKDAAVDADSEVLASDEEWVTDSDEEEVAVEAEATRENELAANITPRQEASTKVKPPQENEEGKASKEAQGVEENEMKIKAKRRKKRKRRKTKALDDESGSRDLVKEATEISEDGTEAHGTEAKSKVGDEDAESDDEVSKEESKEEIAKRLKEEEAAERAAAFRGMASSASMRSLFATPSNNDEDGEPSMQIKVVLRCRPLFDDEKDAGALDVVKCTTNDVTVLPSPNHEGSDDVYLGHNKGRQRFGFERVYGRATTQQQIFEETVRPSILSAVEGYNVTVFAYGQTGTGKTFTMEGDMESTELAGIIPRSVYAIYDLLQSTCMPGDYEITVSHLEIYQEELNDLLSPHNEAETLTARLSKRRFTTSLALAQAAKKRGVNLVYDPSANARMAVDALRNGRLIGPLGDVLRSRIMAARLKEVDRDHATQLRIIDNDERGVIVKNLTERAVKSPEQIFEVLEHSIAKRVTAETMCNGQSSRSHAVFTINVHVKERDASGKLTGIIRIGKLNLVDLSGSENRKRAGGPGVGIRASESKAINQGLLALGRVIKARTEGGTHIPFRDSKLTRFLEESLGGNCITTLILTISPNHKEVGETLSTLNYAHKAKVIENRPRRYVQKEKIEKGSGDEGTEGSDSEYSDEDGNGVDGKRRHSRRKHKGGMKQRPHGGASWRQGRVVMPWVGRVPVRKQPGRSNISNMAENNGGESMDMFDSSASRSGGYAPRSEPALGEARMLHVPSVDWVKNVLLESEGSNDPFKIDPATNDAKEFGFSSARIIRQTTGNNNALSSQAVAALNEIFSRFTREDLKSLQGYINSSAGTVLNRAIYGDGGNTATSGKAVTSVRSHKTISNSTHRSTHSSKSSFPESIRRIGPITPQIFLKIFAAAARIDPIRATFVISKLGYRPNFSSLDAPDYEAAGEEIMTSTLTEMHRTLGSTGRGRSAISAGRRATAPKGKSPRKTRTRPASASAAHRRNAVGGTQKRSNKRRPSTAGAKRRQSRDIKPPSSFIRGDITARHQRGPIHFYWKWLQRAPKVAAITSRSSRKQRSNRRQ